MKKGYIKYEKLSQDIKKAIEAFHAAAVEKNPDAAFDQSLMQWFESDFDRWLVERYTHTGEDSRRRHFRLNLEMPVKVIDTIMESANDDASGQYLVGKVINISRGGLYFRYNRPIEVSSIIKVGIDLSKLDHELHDIEALAMVLRVDRLRDKDFGIGIMFSSIYDMNKECLDLFILKSVTNYLYVE